MEINTIIFDLGGVLIDWNPRYVYRTIFKTEEEIDWFFENAGSSEAMPVDSLYRKIFLEL